MKILEYSVAYFIHYSTPLNIQVSRVALLIVQLGTISINFMVTVFSSTLLHYGTHTRNTKMFYSSDSTVLKRNLFKFSKQDQRLGD